MDAASGAGGAGAGAASPSAVTTPAFRRLTTEEELKRKRFVAERKASNPLYYGDYLQLDKILNAQEPVSNKVLKGGAHDEHLFIVIHQVYELWFKQVLFEVNSVIEIFNQDFVPEQQVFVAVRRLERVTEIQRILLDQVKVLETMSPLDFLEFRDFLFPASGFQSKQFRLLENRLGLPESQRLVFGKARYCSYLNEKDAKDVVAAEHELPTLHGVIQRWLERTPFMKIGGFDTWKHYQRAVEDLLKSDEQTVASGLYTEDTKAELLEGIKQQRLHFQTLLDKTKYAELQARGEWRLSHKATIAALVIILYKEEPVFHVPARLLDLLIDVDEFLTAWRHRHALMVHRMLGVKIGTGGSSGYHYLRATAARHKIFSDFANLATFLIPRVTEQLGFAGAALSTPSLSKNGTAGPRAAKRQRTSEGGDKKAVCPVTGAHSS